VAGRLVRKLLSPCEPCRQEQVGCTLQYAEDLEIVLHASAQLPGGCDPVHCLILPGQPHGSVRAENVLLLDGTQTRMQAATKVRSRHLSVPLLAT